MSCTCIIWPRHRELVRSCPTHGDEAERWRREGVSAPSCPNCGAPGIVNRAEFFGDDMVMRSYPTTIECSARCFVDDPDGYLAAANRKPPSSAESCAPDPHPHP